MITSAISGIVHMRLVTTTSIVAKLAVCAVLLAGIDSAHAAKSANTNEGADAKGGVRRAAAHVTLKKPLGKNPAAKNLSAKNPAAKSLTAKKVSARKSDQSKAKEAKLARLERDWKRLHSRRQVGLLNRLVACREYGRCDGLKVHPTLGAALIRVSPERPSLGAAVAAAPEKEVTSARGNYAAAKARKPVTSAKLRIKQPAVTARIRSASAEADDVGSANPGAARPLYGGASLVNP